MQTEHDEYERLVRPMEERMMRMVWGVTRNADDAEEALQEALAHTAPDAVGRAYLLFKDPGGRPVTPEDVRDRAQSVTETQGQT